ncbi:MAG: hypothetical protein ACLRZH_17020 [Ruthenibacterium lactatiformans]
MKTEYQTHDLSLPAWGPYTKQYSGISHIPAANDGVRFDLAVFPGLYRRRVDVPNVRFESGYHVWKAAPDLSCYTLRHELEWKDRVYADVSFAPLGENARLIRVECCNGTDTPQNLVLHYMASAHDPVPSYRRFALTGAEVRLPEHAAFVLAKDYDDLRFAVPRPTDGLGWDGMRRAEEPVEGFAGGYGVGLGFGCAAGYGPFGQPLPSGAGDAVTYTFTLEQPLQRPCLCVRYINADSAASDIGFPRVMCWNAARAAAGGSAHCLSRPLAAGAHVDADGRRHRRAKLDCFTLCEAADSGAFCVTPRGSGACPEMELYEKEGFLTLKYPHIRECYGVLWDYESVQVRQIENSELDVFLRETVHDHVSSTLHGDGKGHFTNVFLRPIPLAAGQSKRVYGAVCSAGTLEEAAALCRELRARREALRLCGRPRHRRWSRRPCCPRASPLPSAGS